MIGLKLFKTTFSNSFPRIGSRSMGLYEVAILDGLPGLRTRIKMNNL